MMDDIPVNEIPSNDVREADWKYQDPDDSPSRKGLLLSNEIEKFCKKSVLIRLKDYDEKHLRPASYTLTIGEDYVNSSGKRERLIKEEKPFFYMEPNSIVYVSTKEELNLPFYIAARFNLRVKWVYKGILLGTGPQVEPGFSGKLSCPLFNLTDKPIKIHLDEEFATIDFERTTAFCPGHSDEEIKSVRVPAKGATGELLENLDEARFDGERFLMFRQKKFPALKHLPDHDVISSLVQLHDELKTWRVIGIGTVVAFFALTLALLNFQNSLYQQLRAASDKLATIQQQIASKPAGATDSKQGFEGRSNQPRIAPSKAAPVPRHAAK